jgi:secondary thiamine-phosphate synthase enzyme
MPYCHIDFLLKRVEMNEYPVQTTRREEFLRLDAILEEACARQGLDEGLLLVHVPHTTAGVTINENGDPDVPRDLLLRLATLAEDPRYRHFEGNSDAHLKSSLVGCQVLVPVRGGRPRLGRWQSVWFCEFDGPRQRQVWISGIGG